MSTRLPPCCNAGAARLGLVSGFRSALLSSAALAVAFTSGANAQSVAIYDAVYQIEYKGRDAGSSQFSVSRGEADGHFRFLSNSELKGLVARLVAPRPVVEDSAFSVVDGRIEPASFRYEDGSRKGENNYEVRFDWPATATLTVDGGSREIPLERGVLDRGTAQVALATAVAAGRPPDSLAIIDDDGLEHYEISALEPADVTTAAGQYETVRYAQQRVGSSRRTVFWLAPSLAYLPVRIEQIRDGEAETVFILSSIELE